MEVVKILGMICENVLSALIAPAGVELGLAMLARVNTPQVNPDMWMALNVV